MKTSLAVSALLLAAVLARADQITMNNGDRLTGAIVKSDGKTLTIKSDMAGVVGVPWSAVQTIASTTPLNVALRDGGTIIGPVTTAGDKVEVQTKDAGTVTVAKEAIQAIRSPDEQAEIERLRNPRLLDLWSGFFDAGIAATRGNSSTTTINIGMDAVRKTSRDKIEATLTSLYATNKTSGVKVTTADAVRGSISYSLNVSQRAFAFGFLSPEFDKFQHLDLRMVVGGGFGYHMVKSERTSFDLFGGATLNKEFFSNGLHRTSGELLGGEELVYKLSRSTLLHERLAFYPNLTDTGQYRMNFDTDAVTSINKWLAFHLTLSDRYLSDPVFGAKPNDLLLTTGIRLTFAR